MKTKLVLFLLLFVTLFVQSIAYDRGFSTYSNESEIVVEYENNEKDIEQEALLLVNSSCCALKALSFVLPSSVFLDNYLSKDVEFKPPILLT